MKEDYTIEKDVRDALLWQPELKAVEINVSVREGIVVLAGAVTHYGQKLGAERTAKNVLGVKAVIQNLKVKINTWTDPTDDSIKKEIENTFKWHWNIPEEQIIVKVENGWVTLEGSTATQFQKEEAEDTAGKLVGVKGINNTILVHKPTGIKINKGDIEAALCRCIDTIYTILVEVKGNRVTLSGTVTTLRQKEEAERMIWNTPGVQQIDNQLVIELKGLQTVV